MAAVNRYPRGLSKEYTRELIERVRGMHGDVLAIVDGELRRGWTVRMREASGFVGMVLVALRHVREAIDGWWADGEVEQIAKRYTHAGVRSALRAFLTELRQALRSRWRGDVLLPGAGIERISEARVLAQVEAIKSIPSAYYQAVSRAIGDAATYGVSYEELSEQLQEIVGLAESRAEMIAVTELNRTYAEITYDRHRQVGVRHVIWVTAPDPCEVCEPLNGKRFTLDQAHDMLPRHPRCRCTVIADPEEIRSLL